MPSLDVPNTRFGAGELGVASFTCTLSGPPRHEQETSRRRLVEGGLVHGGPPPPAVEGLPCHVAVQAHVPLRHRYWSGQTRQTSSRDFPNFSIEQHSKYVLIRAYVQVSAQF